MQSLILVKENVHVNIDIGFHLIAATTVGCFLETAHLDTCHQLKLCREAQEFDRSTRQIQPAQRLGIWTKKVKIVNRLKFYFEF